MCFKPEPMDLVPEETVRIARAASPKGTIYWQLRDAVVGQSKGMLW
jgi:hypothetical protein